jgi:Zn-dependent protease
MALRFAGARSVVRGKDATIAGVPLRVSQMFLATALVVGFLAGQDVARTRLVRVPKIRSLDEALHVFDRGSSAFMGGRPSFGLALAAGLAVAVIYALSVVAHELGHLAVARRLGVGVGAMQLHAFGGYVEVVDDDSLTAGKLAAIAGAGPFVTAVLALVSAVLLSRFGWPLTGVPIGGAARAAAAGRVLSAAFTINILMLMINLLPVRALDGGQLLYAARLWRGRSGG